MSEQYESVDLVGDRTVSYVAIAVVLAALTAAFSQMSLPLGPVPFTMQTLGVYLAGLLLGPVWGAFALVLYVLVGAAGAPVFSNFGAGIGVIVGPTGGYIVGFPIAAFVIGAIVHRQVEPRRLDEVPIPVQIVGMLAGLLVIYTLGVAWLAYSTDQAISTAIVQGGLVFVPGDVIKAGAAIALITGGYLYQAGEIGR